MTKVDKVIEELGVMFDDVEGCPADHNLFKWDCWCDNKVHQKSCWRKAFRDNLRWDNLNLESVKGE